MLSGFFLETSNNVLFCCPATEMASSRAASGPSSAAYTRLPNDSAASVASSTQVNPAKRGLLDRNLRRDALGRDEEEYREEDEDDDDDDDDEEDEDEERRQDGVRQAEAITSVWTLRILIITYILYAKMHGMFEREVRD